MKKLTGFLLGIILSNSHAYAVTEVLTEPMKKVLKQSPSIPSISHIIISTIFMIVIIYAVAIIYQKLTAFNNKRFSGQDEKVFNLNKLKIINCLSLGPNKVLHIVEVNDKYLVLGSTQTNINLLKEFDKSELHKIAEIPQEEALNQEINPEAIEEELKNLFSTKKEEQKPQKEEEKKSDFEEIYKKYI